MLGWGGGVQPGPVLGSRIASAVSCLPLLLVRKVRDTASFFGFIMNDIQSGSYLGYHLNLQAVCRPGRLCSVVSAASSM